MFEFFVVFSTLVFLFFLGFELMKVLWQLLTIGRSIGIF